MRELPEDPFDGISLADFAVRFRQKAMTAEFATRAYLARIEALDPNLGAYVHVAADDAIAHARAVDRLLAAGADLGPLMGVPIAVKDLFVVEGMQLPAAGSNVQIDDLLPNKEGSFVRSLRQAGSVLLGKTKMTEFALGLVNLIHPPPRNPHDQAVHRVPGGSSSGSAAALAGGLCAMAIGTDTGGSVRQPAALCGVYGLKTTFGLWPCDGMFPTAPTLDTIGLFTRSAADASAAFAVIAGGPIPKPRPVSGLRLGRPSNHYFDNLDVAVADCVQAALAALERAGATVLPVEVPYLDEMDEIFGLLVPSELIAMLGKDRFVHAKGVMDPLVWERASPALGYAAVDYIRAKRRLERLAEAAAHCMQGLDAWVCPTTPGVAPSAKEIAALERAAAWTRLATQNTRPGNMFGQCACSIPLWPNRSGLPVGLQVICSGGRDRMLLSISQGMESVLRACGMSEFRQS